MATRASEYLFLFLLSFIACSSGTSTEDQVFQSSRRELLNSFHYKAIQHDLVYPPSTTYPTTPITIPVTTPSIVLPDNLALTIVTVPATNPVATIPNPVATIPNPVTTPAATIPPATPVPLPNTNPVTPVVPVTNPVTIPSTQPVTTPTPSGGVPVTTPTVTNPTLTPVTTNAPAIPGQTWCVAKSGLQQTALQAALDYACGMGGADCSAIQQGGICYNPNSLQNHASFAFNNYFQKNPTQTSCDFGGTAMITNANPSSGSCIYPLSSLPSSTPVTSSTPTTASSTTAAVPGSSTGTGTGTGTPTVLNNASNPVPGGSTTGFANSPPTTTTLSMSNKFQYVGCITMATSIVTGIVIMF